MHKLITKDLAHEFRLDWCHNIIVPVEETEEIVPEKLSHFYLINNFEIDQSIIDYYYYPTRSLISEIEFQEMVKRGYVGNINTTLEPYSVKMFGAYFRRKAMFYRILALTEHNKDVLLNGNKINCFNDLKPYFKEYADGFKIGFNDFENEIIKPYKFDFSDKYDSILKVFEFITNKNNFEHNWLNYFVGFTISEDFKGKKKEITNAFADGKNQGYFYKAWSIVLAHSKKFQPLFKDLEVTQTKNKIAHELTGDNKSNCTIVVFHHIKGILKKYKLTKFEAKQILLEMQGSFSHKRKKNVVLPIIEYLTQSENTNDNEFRAQISKRLPPIKKQFKDFFTSTTEQKVIKNIQNNYKAENGKRMAYLIYLLDVEFNIINYSLNSKGNSRKHFVEALANEERVMYGINKVFETHTYNLKHSDYFKDKDYIKIKKELENILK